MGTATARAAESQARLLTVRRRLAETTAVASCSPSRPHFSSLLSRPTIQRAMVFGKYLLSVILEVFISV